MGSVGLAGSGATSCHTPGVSKAFTKDEGESQPTVVIRRRAPLPEGTPNYVTRTGLALLQNELEELEREREGVEDRAERAAMDARLAELGDRIASARLVDMAEQARDEVRFGATVTVESDAGEERYRIVGVDEADAARGRIAFIAPLARALLGKQVGDVALVRTPAGEAELEVVAIDYGEDALDRAP